MNIKLIAAITNDGFIGKNPSDRSFDWTSDADKQFYITQIRQADAIIIGRQTFSTFSRYPKNSTWVIMTREPQTFINPKPEIITTIPTNQTPTEIIDLLDKQGKTNIVIAGGSTIYTLFMDTHLVNQVLLTRETNITFNSGIPLFTHPIDLGRPTTSTPLGPQTILEEYSLIY